ncbi:MAG TPA: YccF domain-containing protein [Firmicutes bacterium]|nr:YccF domain-containing protein [Bacillota bacterium]
MNIIGNILWIILGGIIIFLLYILGGIVLCLTIVGIPFGVQCFKLATLGLIPFGKVVTGGPSTTGTINVILNVLWIITFGLTIAATHIVLALFLGLTIIGIPFARQHIKLASLALTPFGHSIQ